MLSFLFRQSEPDIQAWFPPMLLPHPQLFGWLTVQVVPTCPAIGMVLPVHLLVCLWPGTFSEVSSATLQVNISAWLGIKSPLSPEGWVVAPVGSLIS